MAREGKTAKEKKELNKSVKPVGYPSYPHLDHNGLENRKQVGKPL